MNPLKNLLGIVIYEQTIAVAEVESVDGSFAVRKCAEYTLPQGITIENLSSESAGFKLFLKEHAFKSKKAVIGLSAKQMISTWLKLPHIEDPQVLHETIQIHLGRKTEVDFSEIVFDYDDQLIDEDGILVMMILKKMLISVKEFLRETKIIPVQITATSLGLDLRTHSSLACHIIEYPLSYEVCLFQNSRLQSIQHISKHSEQTLTIELAQKLIRQVNRICLSLGLTGAVHYCIRSPEHQSYAKDDLLGQLFARPEYKTSESLSEQPLCDLAAEMAGQKLTGSVNSINFLNGRHESAKPTMTSQWLSKIAVLAAAILIFIGIFFLGWHSDRQRIADYQQQLDSMQVNVETAEKMIDQVSYARRWFLQKPRSLEILRELTLSFPENGNIWVTSLAMDESMNQILTGRTVNEDAVLDVVETLQSKPMFTDVKILYLRKMGKGADIMTFAINLRCQGEI